jgi:hypothetical protein
LEIQPVLLKKQRTPLDSSDQTPVFGSPCVVPGPMKHGLHFTDIHKSRKDTMANKVHMIYDINRKYKESRKQLPKNAKRKEYQLIYKRIISLSTSKTYKNVRSTFGVYNAI